MVKLTAETITDEQIRGLLDVLLRDSREHGGPNLAACRKVLGYPRAPRHLSRSAARAICAEVLNARASEVAS